MDIWVQSWRPRTIAFCDFSSPSKRLRLPRKSDVRSYEVLHLSRKIISANLKIWCSKMQPLSGNQRPDLLRALMKMSLVLRLPRKMHLCRSCSNVPRLPSLLEMPQNPHVLLTFDKVHNPLRLPRESTSERPKVVRTPCVFTILISKCASRHNGVQFFISHLARWLRTRSLSEPTFRPSGATNHWNNTILCDFPTFSRICIFFLLTLSLLWSSLFYSSLLSDSSHLCFSSVHIVGSLTSKLPSIIAYIYPFMNCKTHVNPAAQLHGDCPLSGPAGVPSLRWGTSWHTRSMPRVQQPLFPGHPGYPWIILRHTATHCDIQIIHLPFRWRRYVCQCRSIHDCCSGNMADFIARNQPVHCLWTCFSRFWMILVDVCQEICGVSA